VYLISLFIEGRLAVNLRGNNLIFFQCIFNLLSSNERLFLLFKYIYIAVNVVSVYVCFQNEIINT
jgi:hypothetical protein